MPVLFEGSESGHKFTHRADFTGQFWAVLVSVFSCWLPFFLKGSCVGSSKSEELQQLSCCASSWSWAEDFATLSSCSATATGIAGRIESRNLGSGRGNCPLLLWSACWRPSWSRAEMALLQPRDRCRILIQSCSRGDRISLLILEHFLLAHPKTGLYICSIVCWMTLPLYLTTTMCREYGLLQFHQSWAPAAATSR